MSVIARVGCDGKGIERRGVHLSRSAQGRLLAVWQGGRLNTSDQTHHFAVYFTLGTNLAIPRVLGAFATLVQDDTPANNPGDYLLAVVGVSLGEAYRKDPKYMGRKIWETLKANPKPAKAAINNTQWNKAIQNASIYITESEIDQPPK